MDIWMIWVTDPSDPSMSLWLVEAWDDDTISSNNQGWQAALQDAVDTHGGRNIRIAKTSVNIDAIRASFLPVEA